jgi:hypothetical protein
VRNIVKALNKELALLESRVGAVKGALAALVGSGSVKRRKTYAHSAATKKRLSIAMRKRWRAKRKAA